MAHAHSFGNTDTKSSWLESMKFGRTKYKAVNCSGRKVRVFGDAAPRGDRSEIGGQPVALSFPQRLDKDPQG
jgi:hypothetical protein